MLVWHVILSHQLHILLIHLTYINYNISAVMQMSCTRSSIQQILMCGSHAARLWKTNGHKYSVTFLYTPFIDFYYPTLLLHAPFNIFINNWKFIYSLVFVLLILDFISTFSLSIYWHGVNFVSCNLSTIPSALHFTFMRNLVNYQ